MVITNCRYIIRMVVDRENGKVEKQKKREKRLKVKRGVRNANGEGIFWMPSGCLLDAFWMVRFRATAVASRRCCWLPPKPRRRF